MPAAVLSSTKKSFSQINHLFHKWIEKVHHAESQFPGFQKVFIQTPQESNKNSWITLLQFDTAENLERWLGSRERQLLQLESKEFIQNRENHRLLSSFDGWFSEGVRTVPPKWKQTMMVLLVLFPLIMLEFQYLYPLLTRINTTLRTFLGNVLTVILIAWPCMPLAIYFFKWWLLPDRSLQINILGTLCACLVYLLEIYLLGFLP